MRQEKSGGDEERPVLRCGFDLLHRPTRDLVIAFAGIVVVERPHAPIHERVIAHGGGGDEFLRWPRADAAEGRGDLKFGADRCCDRGGVRLGFAFAGSGTGRARAGMEDFPRRSRTIAVIGEILRESHAIFPLG